MRIAAAYLGCRGARSAWRSATASGSATALIPTDPAMRLVINYRGPRGTIPTYSFVDLVDGRLKADLFKGRIVLIGASFIGIADSYPGPFDNTPIARHRAPRQHRRHDPRPRFHPRRPAALAAHSSSALVAVLAAAIGVAAALLPTRLAAFGGAVPILSWAAGAQIAFERGLWLPLVGPVARSRRGDRRRAVLSLWLCRSRAPRHQPAFRQYLAPDLVNELAAHPDRLQLGGETRMLSVMFSDIRGFTSISEQFKANPQGLSRLINRGFLPQ